jgi:hypothetical protein
MHMLMASKYIIILSLIILITLTIYKPLIHGVLAASPVFTRQETSDYIGDSIPVNRIGSNQTKGDYNDNDTLDEYTDIQKITYFSNGTILNATLWLGGGFNENPSINGSNAIVAYGILIDADSDQQTGNEGVDYQVEVQWSNKTQTWNKIIVEYSSPYHNRTLDIKENYGGFFKNNEKYVLLAVNLRDIVYPTEYKVMFYAITIHGYLNMKVDLTSWLDIPPSEYSIATLPTPVIVRQGEKKIIGVQLKSTTGFVPNVTNFIPEEDYSSIKLEFINDKLNKSSYGIEPAPFKVEVPKNAQVGQYSVPISANISTGSTFPYNKFVHLLDVNLSSISTEGHKIAKANLTISVVEPLTVQEQVKDFWSVYGPPISLIGAGFAGALATHLFDYLKGRKKARDKKLE